MESCLDQGFGLEQPLSVGRLVGRAEVGKATLVAGLGHDQLGFVPRKLLLVVVADPVCLALPLPLELLLDLSRLQHFLGLPLEFLGLLLIPLLLPLIVLDHLVLELSLGLHLLVAALLPLTRHQGLLLSDLPV